MIIKDGLQFFEKRTVGAIQIGGGIIVEQDKIKQYVDYINNNNILLFRQLNSFIGFCITHWLRVKKSCDFSSLVLKSSHIRTQTILHFAA